MNSGRREDLRLVRGQGRYADDLGLPGTARAFMVRSPHAHAAIRKMDVAAAMALPGVVAVLTGADALADGLGPIPHATGSSKTGSDIRLANRDGSERKITQQLTLPLDRVRYAGEGVVLVVAETLAQARDAAEAVTVDWDPLPAVVRAIDALALGAPQLWDHIPGNCTLEADLGDATATAAAFSRAAHRVRLSSWVQRVTGVHMEPRAVTATWDKASEIYTVRASHGLGVVQMRSELASVLGVASDQIRVIAPEDVGGNFGTRNATYPEFALVAWAARRLQRPVAFQAERSEAFLSDYQGRDLHVDAELALDSSGNFLALRSVNTANNGAYTTSFVPLNKGAQLMPSLYRIPVAHVVARAAVTNTPATIPYRSAGRPEAIYAIERLIDLAAQQCGFDRLELRRRNIISPQEQPYRNPLGVTYDNGDYTGVMERAIDLADWAGFTNRRRASRARGLCRGIAVGNYIETTSGAPRERAEILVRPGGKIEIILGTQNTGQGHETAFPELVAGWFGVPSASVTLRTGDTDFVKAGGGTHSGRSLRMASVVMHRATVEIIERGRRIAAALFEADTTDVTFEKGRFAIEGTDRELSIFEIARIAVDDSKIPNDLRGPFAATSDQVLPGLAFPYGAAVCEVEIDPETGALDIQRYTSVDDVGRALNPMILHGQTHGAIAQGVGQALLEQCVFDPETGQNLSGSFMDYAIPRAIDLPSLTTALSEVPAASHPLGLRPGSEGGTTPALGVTVNAIVHALSEFGITHVEMPVTPSRIWQAIADAKMAISGFRVPDDGKIGRTAEFSGDIQ
ncbi:xanthine dehydrogenase family protein molybdopterin-binding subunit [Bradyrhizobium manausense]|uniref:xanthine dehydrogenase family protein molybdopterin-binding subunit n=1 Tax=Bradyrhizobium manausense TaxID=989370 RepID=UPI0020128B60|nr:xanthine dehydrogenase family protein molybdopterin-binding subunit [Bradyrhizobium manausense]